MHSVLFHLQTVQAVVAALLVAADQSVFPFHQPVSGTADLHHSDNLHIDHLAQPVGCSVDNHCYLVAVWEGLVFHAAVSAVASASNKNS